MKKFPLKGYVKKLGVLMLSQWGCKMVQVLWKMVQRFLERSKLELPYDPAISLLGTDPKELKTGCQRGICTPMFVTAFTIFKMWKQCVSVEQ